MLHTVLRRKAAGESVESIQPDLIIATGKRKGHSPSLASIYRTLAEHDEAQAHPEAHAESAEFKADPCLHHRRPELYPLDFRPGPQRPSFGRIMRGAAPASASAAFRRTAHDRWRRSGRHAAG